MADHLGTPRMILDQTGSLANIKRHDYLPFGEELFAGTGGRTTAQGYTASDNVRQKFTSKERDNETGLDYFLARYYSSTQARFTSPDEFNGGPEELFGFATDAAVNPTFYARLDLPQSLNKYQYTYHNPIRYIDPDGHDVWESLKTFGQGVVGGAKEVGNILMEGSPLVAFPNGVSKILTGKPLIAPFEASNQAQATGMKVAAVASVVVPGGAGKARAVSKLGGRVRQIAGRLKPRTQRHTTTAGAEVLNSNGTKEVLVGSSENTLRPAQKEALKVGETAVSGPGHAEATVIRAAESNGQTVIRVEASRPICSDCMKEIRRVGAVTSTPTKP